MAIDVQPGPITGAVVRPAWRGATRHIADPIRAQALPRPGGPRIGALDGLRGVAILLVLVDHLARALAPGLNGPAAARLARCGWVGVDLFFVLSGFLITGILFDTRQAPGYFRNFYARRVLRIFPLYYGVVFATLVLIPWLFAHPGLGHLLPHGGARLARSFEALRPHQLWLWLYGSNFTQSFRSIQWQMLGHFWSLGVEEHFYLAWPLVVYFVAKRDRLIGTCAGVAAGSLIVRVLLVQWASAHLDVYFFTPCRLDALAIGALAALAARGPGGLAELVTPAKIGAIGCGGSILSLVLLRHDFSHEDAIVQSVGFTLVALFFASVLVLAVAAPAGSTSGRFFAHPVLRFFGKYSYGIYVFHYLVLLVATPQSLAAATGSARLGAVAYGALVLGLSTAVAWLSWHLYEKQFLKWNRRFGYESVVAPRGAALAVARAAA